MSHQVNPYDQATVKQLLEDVLTNTIVEDASYPEDYTITNIKIVVGAFACSSAAISHFYPIPFPENIPLLICCIIGYVVCSSLLQLLASFYEKDYILFTNPKSVKHSKKKAPPKKSGLKARTLFPKYDELFTIELTTRDEKCSVKKTYSIGRWFTENGKMDESKFKDDVMELVQGLEKSE